MRQANNTIKGYLYQFNKSILEIMNADEDASITLEGVIEDIDIELSGSTTTIQCKYHEDKKYHISSVAAPILEMICHYHECSVIGKNMSYVLYAYYADNVKSIDKEAFIDYIKETTNKEIQISYFHRIYEIPDEELRKIYAGIVELKNEFPYMSNEEIKEKIAKMQSDFLDIYNHKKDGDDNGNNENMGN